MFFFGILVCLAVVYWVAKQVAKTKKEEARMKELASLSVMIYNHQEAFDFFKEDVPPRREFVHDDGTMNAAAVEKAFSQYLARHQVNPDLPSLDSFEVRRRMIQNLTATH
jgi:recombinational DNA repair ATPase RecF